MEVFEFKGNAVLCQAMAKILSMRNSGKSHEIRPCTLEIDYNGIRLVDHAQENEVCPCTVFYINFSFVLSLCMTTVIVVFF